MAVLDDDYNEIADGEIGHFLIASNNPGFFLGYHKDPEKTAEVVHDGWYHTGDLASRDADGYYRIAGRSDDCFKSRGIFISPYEIENVLRQHPAIAEACIVPLADAEIGNRIRAVCVLKAASRPRKKPLRTSGSVRSRSRLTRPPTSLNSWMLCRKSRRQILRRELVSERGYASGEKGPGIVFLTALVTITLIGPLAVHMYIPIMPTIQQAFGVSLPDDAHIQPGLFRHGVRHTSVRHDVGSIGRKPVLMVGLALFVADPHFAPLHGISKSS